MVSAIAAAPFAKLRSRGGFAHAGPTPPIREPVGAGGPAGLVPAGALQAVQASLAPAPFDVQRALPNHLPPKRLQDLPNPPKPAGPTNPPSELVCRPGSWRYNKGSLLVIPWRLVVQCLQLFLAATSFSNCRA